MLTSSRRVTVRQVNVLFPSTGRVTLDRLKGTGLLELRPASLSPIVAFDLKALFADTMKEVNHLLSQYDVSLKQLAAELYPVLPRPSTLT